MRNAISWAAAGMAMSLLACGSADSTDAELEPEVIVEPYDGSTGLDPISSAAAYPSGPYGVAVGDVLQDATFFGYQNAEASESGQLETFSLSDFYDPDGEKGIRAIYISVSASWCPPCQAEAKALPEMIESLEKDGLAVAFFQDLYEGSVVGSPATQRDLDRWLKRYKLPFPVVLDPKAKMSAYFDRNSIPYSLVVDPRTMKILGTEAGFDPRKVQLKDEEGNVVLDDDGEPRMVYPLELFIRKHIP